MGIHGVNTNAFQGMHLIINGDDICALEQTYMHISPKLGVQIGQRIEHYLTSTVQKSTRLYDTICTLLRHPDMATQVRHLHLDLRADCHDPHDNYTADNLLDYMDVMGYNSGWKEEVMKGSETGLAGLLLTLLPELEHLEFCLFKQSDSQEAPWGLIPAKARKDSVFDILHAKLNSTVDTKVAAEIEYESTPFSTYEVFREPFVDFDAHRIAAFRNLTSICSPNLLPWAIMCLPNLRQVEVGLEIDNCGRFEFDLPESAQIPEGFTDQSKIISLTAQVPIEFLYTESSDDRIFDYLPTVLRLAPDLKHLSLQLKRDADDGPCPGNDIDRSYQTLVRSLRSRSLEELIIDTCDIEASAVRNCQVDFFESLYPITSLRGLPNLRRIVAPQEAFMLVEGSLKNPMTPYFVTPTSLLPDTIETIEIIDSTSSFNFWATSIFDTCSATTGLKVSSLPHVSKIVLWCDRWYPTLVPDYRTDEWCSKDPNHYPVPGRGGRESDLLSAELYGEYPGFETYEPTKRDNAIEVNMSTGARVELDMLDHGPLVGRSKKDSRKDSRDAWKKDPKQVNWRQKEVMNLRSSTWVMLYKAGIKVEMRSDEERGWRE